MSSPPIASKSSASALCAVPRRPLEEQVLDEVRDPGTGAGLVARARGDPEPERNRANAPQAVRDHALASGERRDLGLAHAVDPSLSREAAEAAPSPGLSLSGDAPPRPPRPPRSSRGGRGSRGGASFARSTSVSGETSSPFSCFATSLRPMRPRSLSTSCTITSSVSPRVRTSSMCATRPGPTFETWSRPSVPFFSSTKAPKSVVLTTRPV